MQFIAVKKFYLSVWDYKKSDTNSIRRALKQVNWEFLFQNKSVHEQVLIFNKTLLNFFSHYVPNKIVTFKACVRYFLSNFYFIIKLQTFNNYKKCFLFHRKSSFCSRDIQIFVFFPFLSTISRLKRTNETGIIYDVMNWFA